VALPLTCWVCWPVLPFLSVGGLILGIAAWVLGQGDLGRISRGAMDPAGQGSTQAGWICGIIGTFLNLVVVLGCGGMYGFLHWSSMQQSQRFNPPRFGAPPGRR
jgi:hypothetical protein